MKPRHTTTYLWEWLKKYILTTPNADEDVEKLDHSYIVLFCFFSFYHIPFILCIFILFLTSLLEYNFFLHRYWSIIALQWCVSFCFITKWISYTYTYTYICISPPSCVSLPPSLSHPSRWSQSSELITLCYALLPTSYVLHLVVYISPCHSLTSSQLTLPPPRVLESILYVCFFIPVLPLGSS